MVYRFPAWMGCWTITGELLSAAGRIQYSRVCHYSLLENQNHNPTVMRLLLLPLGHWASTHHICTLIFPKQWRTLASFLSRFHIFSEMTAHVSLPYNIAVHIQYWYNLPFTLSGRPLVTTKDRNSFNFAQIVLNWATALSELLPSLLIVLLK